jgi:hypothetical protein
MILKIDKYLNNRELSDSLPGVVFFKMTEAKLKGRRFIWVKKSIIKQSKK